MDGTQNITVDPNSYRVQEQPNLFVSEAPQLGQNEFLQLLVAQLENQDPLEPMQDTEFIAQLATFSSLEELTDLNTRMDTMIEAQGQLVNSQSLELVGREVFAETGGSIQLRRDGAEGVVFDLLEVPSAARIEIYDGGHLVRSIEVPDGELYVGRHQINWDGLDEEGEAVEAGLYEFRVVATDGQGVESRLPGMVSLPVEGLNVGAGGLFLLSGGRVLSFDQIVEVRSPVDGAGTEDLDPPDTGNEQNG